MRIDRVCMGVCFAIALAAFAGCSSQNSEWREKSMALPLEVRFLVPSAEQELLKLGLMPAFKSYWQAHRDRNWSRRYSLEDLKQNPSEKFYVAYYERAWALKSVVVRGVTSGAKTASINIAVTLSNPGTSEETIFEAIEVWNFTEDKWRHEVSDPMLIGIKQ